MKNMMENFPKKNLNLYLDYLNIDYNEFFETIDNHRNDEIWLKK